MTFLLQTVGAALLAVSIWYATSWLWIQFRKWQSRRKYPALEREFVANCEILRAELVSRLKEEGGLSHEEAEEAATSLDHMRQWAIESARKQMGIGK